MQRDAQLVVGFQQLGIHFIQALGPVFVRLRSGVIGDLVEIDRRVVHMGPLGFPHIEPLAVCLQAPLEHEFGFVLARRYGAHDAFVEAGR